MGGAVCVSAVYTTQQEVWLVSDVASTVLLFFGDVHRNGSLSVEAQSDHTIQDMFMIQYSNPWVR